MNEEEFERRVAEWHRSDSDLTLHEFLGMSWDEYSARATGGALMSQDGNDETPPPLREAGNGNDNGTTNRTNTDG